MLRKYIKLCLKVRNLSIKSDKTPEILNIDPILDKRMVRDLLSSLENVEYIKNLYKEKKLNVSNSKIIYNFHIGDGVTKINKEKVKKSFKIDSVEENTTNLDIKIDSEKVLDIMPIIYKDIRGELWYVESPIDGMYIPEICLHFLIISALCNIMRYSPSEWSGILNNNISSAYSLLIRRYIELFETKFPMLVVSHLTNYSLNMTKSV